MSNKKYSRTSEANKAIKQAWVREQELVKVGKGTRDWTPEQQKDILENGRAYDEKGLAFEGHHMKSVETYPECQGDVNNIQFLNKSEHYEAHDGNWRNSTNWYYDPITKKKTDFKDGPVILCEIKQLSNSIVKDTNYGKKNHSLDKTEINEQLIVKRTGSDTETKNNVTKVAKVLDKVKDYANNHPEIKKGCNRFWTRIYQKCW